MIIQELIQRVNKMGEAYFRENYIWERDQINTLGFDRVGEKKFASKIFPSLSLLLQTSSTDVQTPFIEKLLKYSDSDKAIAFIRLKAIRRVFSKVSAEDGGYQRNETTIDNFFDQHEITLLKSGPLEADQQLKRFKSVAETAQDAIIVIDSTSKILFWNTTAEKMFGYTKAEIKGEFLTAIMPERFREMHFKGVDRFLSTGEAHVMGSVVELAGLKKSGKEFPIELSLNYWLEDENYFFSGIIRDISERKKNELVQKLIIDISKVIGDVKDYDEALHLTLQIICKMTGWDLGEVWKPNDDDLMLNYANIWYSNSDDLIPFIEESKTTSVRPAEGLPGRVWTTQQVEWMPDVSDISSRFFIRHTIAKQVGLKTGFGVPITDNGKTLAVLLFYSKDVILEDWKLLEIIKAAAVPLGSVIQRKKAEIELRQRTDQLAKSNQDLEHFAYIASHDLQEPLRKIISFGDRLRMKIDNSVDQDGIHYLERMQYSALRLSHLIESLLDYSRVNKLDAIFGPVNLNRIINAITNDLELQIKSKNARIEVAELPVINADSVQVRQLFQNLIANALKFVAPDTIPYIQIFASPSSAYKYEIHIKDNGIGFDEKYLEEIFKPFKKLHTREKYEGSGIGLAICKKIMEKHHGKLLAKSTPGSGTEFILQFPDLKSEETTES